MINIEPETNVAAAELTISSEKVFYIIVKARE